MRILAPKQLYRLFSTKIVVCVLSLMSAPVFADPSQFSTVVPNYSLTFPHDFGAHPNFRLEWWYITGWLETPDKKSLGFQVTFFRSATGHNPDNPSKFAPKQLIIAHVALSDPTVGKLLHAQKTARAGFGLAYAKQGNTDVKLDNWHLIRQKNGHYQVNMHTQEFGLQLSFTPTQTILQQGNNGFSRKGPKLQQASYYYSEPHLSVTGTVSRHNKQSTVSGQAWLDHEWSSEYLAPHANGWDWVGANLDDGSSLMAFQIRHKNGKKLWAYAALRNAAGHTTFFKPEQVEFTPERTWQSPHTEAVYPVAMRIRTGKTKWLLTPLFDDQELDARQSTGTVYWEGAVTLTQDNQPAGRGYLELTGYDKSLKLTP